MARKGQRQIFGLFCTVCKNRNYISEKNRTNTPDKLALSKYCRFCRKHTQHRETSDLD